MNVSWEVVVGLLALGLAALPSTRITRTILILSRWLLRIAIVGIAIFACMAVFEPLLAGSVERMVRQFLSAERNSFLLVLLLPCAGLTIIGLVLHAILGVALGEGHLFFVSEPNATGEIDSSPQRRVRSMSPREVVTELGHMNTAKDRRSRKLSDVVGN